MISVTSTYKEIMNRPIRNRAYLEVKMFLVNQNAQAEAEVSGDFAWYSNANTIWSEETITENEYATLEHDFWKADGSMFFLPEDSTSETVDQNLITRTMGSSITVSFDTPHDIQGITIDFGDAYPTEFILQNGQDDIHDYTNDSRIFTTKDIFKNCSGFTITPVSMVGNEQRLRIHNILLGYTMIFTNNDVSNMSLKDYVHSLSEELPSLDFSLEVLDYDEQYGVDDVTSPMNFFETGQLITLRVGLEYDDEQTVEWLKVGTLYLRSWSSDKYRLNVEACDKLALLTGNYTASNRIYTRTLYEEAETVFAAAGITDYWIDNSLQDITISNPLPEGSYAQCLQLIANAGRCIIRQNNAGTIMIKASFSTVIDPEDITVTSLGGIEYSNDASVLAGAEVVYADVTHDFWKADGSLNFLPEDSEDYMAAGYISSEVADSEGNFNTNPSITFDLGGGFIYYSIIVVFESNAPQEVVVHTSYNEQSVEDITFDNLVKGANALAHEFALFDTFTLEFTKGNPNDRIYISKIALGNISDYTIRQFDMMSFAQGDKEERTSEVSVRIFTYTTEEGKPKQVEDDVWETLTTDYEGYPVEYENPLVSTQEHAALLAEWIGNYYKNNISYQVSFRGEPRIEAGDIIFMDNDYVENLQVEVQEASLSFNGGFSGDLTLRRALNNVDL